MILFTMGWMIMPMPVLIKPTIFRNLHLTSVLLPVRVPAQLVLLAMGFVGSEERLLEEFKLAKAPNGSIAADDSSYVTNVPGVFAAGDARRGQSLVVWAIAEGRGAAHAVDKFLQK